jgi:hypothetical protein
MKHRDWVLVPIYVGVFSVLILIIGKVLQNFFAACLNRLIRISRFSSWNGKRSNVRLG